MISAAVNSAAAPEQSGNHNAKAQSATQLFRLTLTWTHARRKILHHFRRATFRRLIEHAEGVRLNIVDASQRKDLSTSGIAVLLAWVAGFVDAVGWVTVFQVYTSHMTGNTAHFGIASAQGKWSEALRFALPLPWFMAGSFFGAFTTAAARRHKVHSSFAIALSVELALVIVFILAGNHGLRNDDLVALLSTAMGIQTVTVTRVAGLRIYTTYLTGSLTKFAEAVVRYVFWFHDRTRGRMRRRWAKVLRVTARLSYVHHAVLLASLWGAFFAGAYSGATLRSDIGLSCLGVPAVLLLLAIIVDLCWPADAAEDNPADWDDL